jgi:hypothetical protein
MSDRRRPARNAGPRAVVGQLLAGVAALLILDGGCGKAPDESFSIASGPDPTTAAELERANKIREQIEKQFSKREPVEPLPPTQLASFLPDAPAGWVADDPEMGGDKRGDAKFTDAARNYHVKDYSKTATVRLRDTGGHYIGWAELQGDIEQDTKDKKRGLYSRTTELDGHPSRELGYNEPKGCVMVTLVSARFGVRIEVFGLNADEAKAAFWKPMDIEGLKKIAGP